MDSELLSSTFVDLADTMVADFDIIDFLHMLTDRSVALLTASAAGVVLADPRGVLRVAAASNEAVGMVELFQIQNDQGPCLDCFRTGRSVTAADLSEPGTRWPRFAAAATEAGFRTVEALPMRLRDQVIGALNLFRATPVLFEPADLRIAQALADVATIGLLQERSLRRSETMAEQLQAALNSRVVIEQAKGKLGRAPGHRYGRGLPAAPRPRPQHQPAAHRRGPGLRGEQLRRFPGSARRYPPDRDPVAPRAGTGQRPGRPLGRNPAAPGSGTRPPGTRPRPTPGEVG